MKQLLIAGFFTLIGIQSFAQEEGQRELSDECKKQLSLMGTYGEQGMWRDAADFFVKAYAACGESTLDGNDWSNARAIYTKLYKAETDEARKTQINDTMYWCYETELKHYPTPKLAAEYGAKLVKDKSKAIGKIDTLFSNSIHQLKERTSVNQIIYYYIHLIGKFNSATAEGKDVARTFAIDEYLLLSDYVAIAIKRFKSLGKDRAVKGYEKAQSYLDNYFGKLAKDCEMITGVLSQKINELPPVKEDKMLKIQTYLNLLEKRGCGKSDLYGQLADSAISISPSASAYYAQGKYFNSREEFSTALTYFQKAVELEEQDSLAIDSDQIDSYNFSLANSLLKNKKYKAAFGRAKKVNGELKGKAMVICAGAIGAIANSCGDTTFERKSNFWLADDYMKKASGLGEEYSSRYSSNAPTTEELFDAGKSAGDKITLKCWGESTTVR